MIMIRIKNGLVYDPANGVNGEVRDIWTAGGKVVSAPPREKAEQEIDAAGMVVFPGGIDIHTHIAGPKVNSGRIMLPEMNRRCFWEGTGAWRSGVAGVTPTSFVTGYLYALMGYTCVMEAAVPPLKARHALEELADVPLVDKGIYTLVGNNHMVLECVRKKNPEELLKVAAWLLKSTGGFALKVVNPGGVENWKRGGNVGNLDDQVSCYGITPRQIIEALLEVNEALKLPHPLHLHTVNIGSAGGFRDLLETIAVAGSLRLHLTHVQFHSYGGESMRDIRSGASLVAESINTHPSLTTDVGQLIFGRTVTMTADAPVERKLYRLGHGKWSGYDVEMETASGVVPLVYKPQNLVNAVQWATGLEIFLLVKNPWQVILSTDHPNGGPFTAYPQVIRLLMDRSYRLEVLASLPVPVRERTVLGELEREYTLAEIAVITRAAPARALGLADKGHLGTGADADIAIYKKDQNRDKMFSRAVWVLKEGRVVVREGVLADQVFGRTYLVDPGVTEKPRLLKETFERYYTVALENYAVEEEYLHRPEVVRCK